MSTMPASEWVRATYSPLTGARPALAGDSFALPSCIASGLSERGRRALLKVFNAACHRTATQRGYLHTQSTSRPNAS